MTNTGEVVRGCLLRGTTTPPTRDNEIRQKTDNSILTQRMTVGINPARTLADGVENTQSSPKVIAPEGWSW